MTTVFKDDFLNAQFLRTIGHTGSGGADLGECFEIVPKIREGDAESWFRAWWDLAQRLETQARYSLDKGHTVSARQSYLKASNYYRTSYVFMLRPNPEGRLLEAYRRQRRAFEAALAASHGWGQAISIPYENSHLHGYFFPSPQEGPRPVLIITGGYDSTCEEAFFYSGPAALARGYHVVTYDGPGQGAALIEDGRTFRPDWENVLRPVLRWIEAQPDVDAGRIAQIGISFGGYLAPRAASALPEIAATVADPGQLSLLEEVRSRMPLFLRKAVPQGRGPLAVLLTYILSRRLKHLTKGWGLRRGLFVHGVRTPIDYLRLTEHYKTDASKISCPTLVCSAEGDEIGATAERLYNAIASPKTRMHFTAEEGTAGHCEALGRSTFNVRVFDWLDDTLDTRRSVDARPPSET